jgi:hypothetical protein
MSADEVQGLDVEENVAQLNLISKDKVTFTISAKDASLSNLIQTVISCGNQFFSFSF